MGKGHREGESKLKRALASTATSVIRHLTSNMGPILLKNHPSNWEPPPPFLVVDQGYFTAAISDPTKFPSEFYF